MSTILSLHGRGLTLDTKADIAPFLSNVDATKIEEVHFGGNTLGVEACEALGEFLQKAINIKARFPFSQSISHTTLANT
jgi:Ran GTPase-activating protein 1